MRAIVVTDEAAGTAGMTPAERPEPPAAINDVIVRVHASGFVPTELDWPSTWTDRRDRDRTPSIPGHELAGVVTALGYGTTGVTVGQRVFGLTDWHRDGTLAEYTAVEARNLAPLPGDVDFTVGASLPISGLTAWQGLFDHGRLKAGQSVLAHGAAGAVGTMVTQLAREAGGHVIGTGRSADRQKALDFGAHEFVDLERRPRRRRRSRSRFRRHRRRRPEEVRRPDPSGRNAGYRRRTARGAARRRLGDRLRRRVRSRPAGRDSAAGTRRTTAYEHRRRRVLRRCRRRLEPDRTTQGEDHHSRSPLRTRGRRTVMPSPSPFNAKITSAMSGRGG
ncbi:NADP-dependent oxidoreductase [Actinomadura geliboluensis]